MKNLAGRAGERRAPPPCVSCLRLTSPMSNEVPATVQNESESRSFLPKPSGHSGSALTVLPSFGSVAARSARGSPCALRRLLAHSASR